MNDGFLMLLGNGHVLVSREDYDALSELTWTIYRSRHKKYAMARIPHEHGYRRVSMHRLITGAPPALLVDHRDGDGTNNTRTNLRVATSQQNRMNTGPTGKTSRFKGVRRDKRSWRATFDRKLLGYFDTEEDAARAYNQAAHAKHGEFAWLNPVEPGEAKRYKADPAGYCWHAAQHKFMASYRGKFLGYYDSAEAARQAYLHAKETGEIKKKPRVLLGNRNASGFRGVSWSKLNQRWVAHIRHAGKARHLGLFHDKKEAARAYDTAAIEIHGERAILNFPKEAA